MAPLKVSVPSAVTVNVPPARGTLAGMGYNVTVPPRAPPPMDVTVAGGGVRAVVQQTDPPHVAEYDPSDPNADENGMVARPNVNLDTELVNMQQAQTMYSANLKVIRTADDMMGALLDSEA